MAGKLQGRKIVITGVSRGIGYETAKLFLKEGALIIGAAKDKTRLDKVISELKSLGDIEGVTADLSQPGFEKAVAEAVSSKWGCLDILMNNAGVMLAYAGVLEDKPGILESTMQVNLYAPYYLTRALVPFLLKGHEPRIINTSSGAGTLEALHAHDIASYRISKLALNGFTITLADELKGKIAVNSFDPGWVKTDLGSQNAPGEPTDSAQGALALATENFSETGKFWHNGKIIAY